VWTGPAGVAPLRALDLCCGAGGLSWGLRHAGFAVRGVDLDPVAVAHYARHVGPAAVGDARELAAGAPVDLVACDLPASEATQPGWPVHGVRTGPNSVAAGVLRTACTVRARVVVLAWPAGPTDGLGAERDLVAAMEAAGLYARAATLCAAHYGAPQLRWKTIVVGCATTRLARGYSWPRPTVSEVRTVREAIGLPYDAPAPALTSSEHLAAWCGMRNGRAKPRRACEVMACAVGPGAWGSPVGLAPAKLAALAALPREWEWPYTKAMASGLIGRAFPPPMAEAIGRRVRAALWRAAGWPMLARMGV
jgi:DNA (cytosine-5)-methyltransferase 1